MKLALAPRVDAAAFQKFLTECSAIVGADCIFATDEDRSAYRDSYAVPDEETHIPAAAVAPSTPEQVQDIVRAAARLGVPIWPISRGKNLGYGGSAPHLSGTVILDMSRMNKIITVDQELGYALIEPGVSFSDLFSHLQHNNIPLWMSCPEQSWGSVAGNALDRGIARTDYGEHTHAVCGLEVVLPDGDIIRTGMGAMEGNKTWNIYKNGFGPGWDQLFSQSPFGIVTKLGIWLMPQPRSTATVTIKAMQDADFEWLYPRLASLARDRVVDQFFTVVNWCILGSMFSARAAWTDKPGPLANDQIDTLVRKLGIGWWNSELTVYGEPSITAAKVEIIKERLKGRDSVQIDVKHWHEGEPLEQSGRSVPTSIAFQLINWYGGRGAHMGFSPVVPSKAEQVIAQVRGCQKLFHQAGRDFTSANHITGKYTIAINEMVYDRDNAADYEKVQSLFRTLVEHAAKAGYGEYRTHLDWMDEVAATYDFNNHALRRLNERFKDAIDPAGIIAPGKSGIWPQRFREERGA